MPKRLMRCVRKVSRTVKPRAGQTKRSAAYGICIKSTGQRPHRKHKS